MSPELRSALDRAKGHVMSPEERFEQRVSFVYGQQDHDNPNPSSKDEIRQMLIKSQGYPAASQSAWQEMDDWCAKESNRLSQKIADAVMSEGKTRLGTYKLDLGQHRAFMRMRSYIHGARNAAPPEAT